MSKKLPLMPKATAVWLIENTALTFEQIGDFCGLHSLEVQALADEEGIKIIGQSPIKSGELTKEEIERCEQDPKNILIMRKSDLPQPKSRSKGPKYTPVSKRGDKPDAIAYVLRHHPELSDAQIVKLIGTTKNTINTIRERTHANIQNIKPRHPVDLGICSYSELETVLEKARKKLEREGKEIPVSEAEKEARNAAAQEEESTNTQTGGFDFSNFLGENTGS